MVMKLIVEMTSPQTELLEYTYQVILEKRRRIKQIFLTVTFLEFSCVVWMILE